MNAAPTIRYHYMDNLRALAMMAGVFFHAALAYSPMMTNLWMSASPENSLVMDAIAWFSHLFRMPLFFLIAGFFSAYLIGKRGLPGFLRNRAVRILLPFVVFWPLILASLIALIVWGISAIDNQSPLLELIVWMQDNPEAPSPPPSTAHLWFLYTLLQLYIIIALVRRTGLLERTWLQVFDNPWFLVVGMPLVIAPALISQVIPHPAPEQFTPKPWALVFYGTFFLAGYRMFFGKDVIDRLRPFTPYLVGLSLVLYVIVYRQVPQELSFPDALAMQQGATVSTAHAIAGLSEAIIAVHMTLVCLVLGKQFLDTPSRFNRFVSDSSYWVYILHLPVLFWIQLLLLDVDWPIWVEFLIASFGTLAIGFASYVTIIRPTPIGWMLNGRLKPAPAMATT